MRAAVVAFVLASLAFASRGYADKLGFDPTAVYKVPRGNSPSDGPKDAPITIVMWSDHACGYCYRVQTTLRSLDKLYPHRIRWVHRTLPLDDDNTLTSEAALAAGAQGKFRPMNDRLYALAGRVDRHAVELVAREVGLDMLRFRADLDTKKYRPQIDADAADARALGVSGTPAFFINGRPIIGNQPLKTFADVVDQELVRAHANAKVEDHDTIVAIGRARADVPGETEHAEFDLDPNAAYRVGLGLPGHQQGPDSALVTIVVWSDFQCPFCARSAPVLAKLREKFGSEVRVVFRHLAMANHKKAALASEAAIAAAEQGKFWAFHDRLFGQFGSLDRADLELFARDAKLDMAAFKAALDDRRYHDVVLAESADALALGVSGTPTMFVNGQPVVGSRDLPTMENIVGAHRDRARAAVAAGVSPSDVYALVMNDALGAERADPSRIPDVTAIKIAMRLEDRGRAVIAACRRRDGKRAAELAVGLGATLRTGVSAVCSASGIDLP